MKYLLVREKNNKFNLYCPDVYGSDTWGSTSQVSLEKKRKYWYIQHWTAGNDWIEDETYEERLNVVLESTDLKEIVSYVSRNTKGNRAAISSILVKAQDIYNDYVAFEHWAASRNKN
jgi:hypothetical protein